MKKFVESCKEVYVRHALLNVTPANYAVTTINGGKYVSLSYLLMDKIDFLDYTLIGKTDRFNGDNYYKIVIFAESCTLDEILRICKMFKEQPEVTFCNGFCSESDIDSMTPVLTIELKFDTNYEDYLTTN